MRAVIAACALLAAGTAQAQQCEYIPTGHQPYAEVVNCPGLPDFGFPVFEVPAAEVPCSVILQRIASQVPPEQQASLLATCPHPAGSVSGPACRLETTPAYNRSGSCSSNKILGVHNVRASRLAMAAVATGQASDRAVQGGFPDVSMPVAQLADGLDVETLREIAEVATRSLDQSWAYLGAPRFALHHPHWRSHQWGRAMCADVSDYRERLDCEALMFFVGVRVPDNLLPELLTECRDGEGWQRPDECEWARAFSRAWMLEQASGYHRFADLADPAWTVTDPVCRQQYCGPANGALDPDQIEQYFRLLLRPPADVDSCGRSRVCGVWTTEVQP